MTPSTCYKRAVPEASDDRQPPVPSGPRFQCHHRNDNNDSFHVCSSVCVALRWGRYCDRSLRSRFCSSSATRKASGRKDKGGRSRPRKVICRANRRGAQAGMPVFGRLSARRAETGPHGSSPGNQRPNIHILGRSEFPLGCPRSPSCRLDSSGHPSCLRSRPSPSSYRDPWAGRTPYHRR